MATNRKGTEPARPGAGFPSEVDRSQQPDPQTAGVAPDAPQETQDVARGSDPRATAPQPPRGLVGMSSRDAVATITLLVQRGEVQGRQHPASGWLAAAEAARIVQTKSLHPLVAQYKAEAVEYLQARHDEALSFAEGEKAEAVSASKQAAGEL